ncbi:MAG: response regulator [Pseudomonadota bacterium]
MKRITHQIITLALGCSLMVGLIAGLTFYFLTKSQQQQDWEMTSKMLHQDYDRLVQYEVQTAASLLNRVHDLAVAGTVPAMGEKELAAALLRDLRYGSEGYFWADTSDGTNVVLLGRTAEGKNRIDLQDSKGNRIIRNILVAAKDGTHYTEYWFPKKNGGEPLPKRSYSDYFQPFDWIIGTGNYIDDMAVVLKRIEGENEKNIRDTLLTLLGLLLLATAGAFTVAFIVGNRISNELLRTNERLQDELAARTRAEADSHEARVLAETANLAKSTFLANMSHEIRTPMNAILGMTELVLDTDLDDRQRDFLQKAHTSSKALLGILNDILDYSKIEAGRLGVESLPTRLEDLLGTLADLFGARVAEKGLELFLDIAPGVPTEVLTDPLRLGQILNNLVGNAVKFTERGEVYVKVEALAARDEGLMLRFAVRDTGIGLSREQAERLFQPFVQADGSITRKYGGTGLGLVICQRLVGLMGGEIGIEGAEGQGITFTFTIAVGVAPMCEPSHDLQQLAGLRILVADHQETSRQILERLLQAWGLVVRCVDSGTAALAEIVAARQRDMPFDVILLDWRLPDINGMEVARRLEVTLGHRRDCPRMVVMVTAQGREQLLAEAGSVRLDGVVSKPVVPSALFNTLLAGRVPGRIAVSGRTPVATIPPARFDGVHVLLAEDNAINQQVAIEFLKKRGIAVTLARHGGEAVAQARQGHFDLVLMDLHMPVMDGLEATRFLRELPGWQDVPIIAMTAAVMPEDRERCTAAGMVDFIAKPIDPKALTETLRRWLSNRDDATSGPPVDKPVIITPSEPPEPDFDLDGVLDRLDDDREMLAELLRYFIAEQTRATQHLDALITTGDTGATAKWLHSLKGAAANLGALALATAAQRLEQEVKAGAELTTHRPFITAHERAMAAISTYLDDADGV